MAWGALNATIIVFAKLNPVIVTLATNFIGLAALFLVFQLAQVPQRQRHPRISAAPASSGCRRSGGRWSCWSWSSGFLMPRTRYGRRTIAVGGNRAAAQARGISLRATRFATFIAAGGFVGLRGGAVRRVRRAVQPGSGNTMQLNVIAAVILAGISLAGGRGNFWMLLLERRVPLDHPDLAGLLRALVRHAVDLPGPDPVIAVAIDGYRARRGTP